MQEDDFLEKLSDSFSLSNDYKEDYEKKLEDHENSEDPESFLPPILVDYYLKECGIAINPNKAESEKLRKNISSIASKLIDEVLENCLTTNKLNSRSRPYNTQAVGSNASNNPKLSIYQFKVMEKTEDDLKKTLTVKDVSEALEQIGIKAEKPDFYI